MKHQTKAVVIGSGPGGYVCAIRLGQLGVKTMLVERESLGGVCLNVGCIPSKAYISAAKIFHQVGHSADIGIVTAPPQIDLAKMKAWKDGVVTRLTSGVKGLLEKAGVTILRGDAKLTGANTLTVKTQSGMDEVQFENAVIATGSRPIEIPPFPFDGKDVIHSTHALDLTEVPKNLVVIGGGVIGLEIGMYLNRFGAKLTVVEMLDQILPGTDAEIVKTLMRELKKRGITVHTETKAVGFERKSGGLEVKLETKDKKPLAVAADKILVSIGRRPQTENLGCEAAGVTVGPRGFIPCDNQRRTNVPHIFAIGDVNGEWLLAHKASKDGLVAAAVIAGGKDVYDVRAMPWGIFTDPEIGGVGLSEDEARKKGHEVRIGKFPFAALGRALAMRETEGFVKLVVDAKDDSILGCQVIGPEAADIVAEITLAIELGASCEDIALTVHSHPTLMESLMEAAEAAHGKAIHIFNPKSH
jgi:dihydrolipoamide dehydrogenase